VSVGKRTVKEGECAAIWNRQGCYREEVGPRVVRLWFSTIRFLDRHVAEADEYLVISHRDGTVEHVRGPTALWETPLSHRSVKVSKAIVLEDSASCIFVRREEIDKSDEGNVAGGSAARQMRFTGPATFFPRPTDKVHTFAWADGTGLLSCEGRVVNLDATCNMPIVCQVQGADDCVADIEMVIKVQLLGDVLAVSDPVTEGSSVVRDDVREVLSSLKFADQGSTLSGRVRSILHASSFFERLAASLSRAAWRLLSFEVVAVIPSDTLRQALNKDDVLATASANDRLADSALMGEIARQEQAQKLETNQQKHELRLAAERREAALKIDTDNSKRAASFLQELRRAGVDVTKYVCREKDQGSERKDT